jgi:hypothetical protein
MLTAIQAMEIKIQGKVIPVPEFIDPFFAKTIPKRSFSMTENERFGFSRKLGLKIRTQGCFDLNLSFVGDKTIQG